MDGFSVTSLTSLTTTISHRTLSCAGELSELIGSARAQHDAAPLISEFSKALKQVHERVSELEASLNSATVISEGLRTQLSQWLGSCDQTTAVLNKQVLRLQADTLDQLEPFFVNVYVKTLVGYARYFQFFVTLLSKTERAEQDEALDAPEGKDILAHLKLALRQASQMGSILQDDDSTNDYASSSKGRVPGYQNEPPPYEASSPTIPGPSEGESSSSPFAAGFSSLTESFKAFAAGFKPKPDPFVTALCQAARRGDVQQMSGFLAQEANINGRNDEGHTPLTCAVMANQLEAVRFLVSAGADHISWDRSKMPPMFLAASLGYIDIARFLLTKGGKINEARWSGQPFFAEVVSGGNMEGIRFLLESGANANTNHNSGRHVIVQPVKDENVELVRLLLGFGANSNAKDLSGNHILALAANTENWDMIKLLLDRGASANGKTVNGTTVLVDSVNKKRYALARELLDRGADANARDLQGQRIIVAVIKNTTIEPQQKVDLVRSLLIHGASPDASDNTWNVPVICHAMDNGNSDIVALLLRHNAKTKKKMRSGETLLLWAIDHGKTDQAKLLLDHGADPNATDKQGRTPLLQAIVRQDLELISALKQHGADLNLVGSISPADLAACVSRPEIFGLLGLATSSASTPQAGPATQTQGRSSGPGRAASPPPNYDAVTGKT